MPLFLNIKALQDRAASEPMVDAYLNLVMQGKWAMQRGVTLPQELPLLEEWLTMTKDEQRTLLDATVKARQDHSTKEFYTGLDKESEEFKLLCNLVKTYHHQAGHMPDSVRTVRSGK